MRSTRRRGGLGRSRFPSPVEAIQSDRAAFLAGAAQSFERAADAESIHERSFTVAGRELVLRFAGPRLIEPLSAALEHHPPGGAGGPRLTVCLWESSSVAEMSALPEGPRVGVPAGEGRMGEPARVRIHYLPAQRALCLLDRADDTAYFCAADAELLPYWEVGSPLLTLLSWWMEEHGRQLVHGAALGTDRGGVLLVGPGGSGKSSTALATLCPGASSDGLRYAGDDYCLVSADPEPRAHSLYGTGKLNPDQAERFPDLVAGPLLNAERVGEEKALFLVSRRWPDRIVHRFPLTALLVPMIDGGRCRVEPITGGAALAALAPSTVLQLPGAGQRALATMADLTRRIPSYALRLSPDPREAPAVLSELVETLVGPR